MQRSILEAYPSADICIGVVWINILENDTETMARQAAERFNTDPRVRHFYDPQKLAGRAVAQSLGSEGEVAWDVYMFYEKSAEWHESPPGPNEWVHQLKGSKWADSAHYFTGDDLIAELEKIMMKIPIR